MAMGALMGSHPPATTPRPQVAAVHSSGQSTWQRGSTLLGSVNVQPSSRCVPVVKAVKSSSQKVTAAPAAERVANEVAPRDLARRWREIGGEKDWEGLLDPLDRTLREEILRYGEFVQATYDNFDNDVHSKYCGSARYNKAKMFSKVGLNQTGYEVQRYFYATADVKNPFSEFFKKPPPGVESWSTDSNWMGYIAVSTDKEKIKQLGRRGIVIAWRGTIHNSEWASNFKRYLSPASMDKRPSLKKSGPSINVETGFLTLYTSKNPKTRYNKTSARTQVLRIVNVNDFVPRVPGLLLNENIDQFRWLEKIIDKFPFTFIHVGTELELNNYHSSYLDPRRALQPGNCHNLEQYLHLIDGHQGKRRFERTAKRPLALVNKSCNFLKDEYFVPESWLQRENKGLVFTKDGWVMPDRELEDIPTADAEFS